MGASTWDSAISPDRRTTPDRRIEHSILCQEALAHIVAETRGEDSYAGRALKELERRRAAAPTLGTGDDELIIYSLRGQWIVGTVRDVRQAMLAAASGACRRRTSKGEHRPEQRISAEAVAGSPAVKRDAFDSRDLERDTLGRQRCSGPQQSCIERPAAQTARDGDDPWHDALLGFAQPYCSSRSIS